MTSDAEPPEPTLLGGRYRLGAPLGEGGTASVYRAFDTLLGAERAVKITPAGPEAQRQSLLRRA